MEPNLFNLTFCDYKKSFKNELADCKIPSRDRRDVDFDTCMRYRGDTYNITCGSFLYVPRIIKKSNSGIIILAENNKIKKK